MTERDRLFALIVSMPLDVCTAAEMTDYLLNNGVILPPCKIGDKVYQLDAVGDIYESEVTQVIYNTKGIAFDERAIGRTVFLSPDEASAALEKLKEGAE